MGDGVKSTNVRSSECQRSCSFLLIIYIYIELELFETTMATDLLQRSEGNARSAGLSKGTPSEAVCARAFYPCTCTRGPQPLVHTRPRPVFANVSRCGENPVRLFEVALKQSRP